MGEGTSGSELEAALALSADEERQLLQAIFDGGWDQGCFLSDEIVGEPIDTQLWLEKLKGRPRLVGEPSGTDIHEKGLPHQDPPGESGWVVISQRCDLLRDLNREPFVELARALKVKGDELGEAGKNSPRFVLVSRPVLGKGAGWILDLRDRAFVPKTRIPGWGEPLQALPDDGDQREDFVLRLGRRYSRKPLPARYVETVQKPLKRIIEEQFVAETAPISDWLLLERGKEMPVLIALIGDDADRVAVEDDVKKVMEALEAEFAEHAETECRVRRRGEIYLAEFLEAYPLDFYEITQGALTKARKAKATGQDPPAGGEHERQSA